VTIDANAVGLVCFACFTFTFYWVVLCVQFHSQRTVVKSRWLCYFQESKSTCRNFYFL